MLLHYLMASPLHGGEFTSRHASAQTAVVQEDKSRESVSSVAYPNRLAEAERDAEITTAGKWGRFAARVLPHGSGYSHAESDSRLATRPRGRPQAQPEISRIPVTGSSS
jgi:hypothetical protein